MRLCIPVPESAVMHSRLRLIKNYNCFFPGNLGGIEVLWEHGLLDSVIRSSYNAGSDVCNTHFNNRVFNLRGNSGTQGSSS